MQENAVVIENLTVKYDDNTPVLSEVNLELPKGELIGIIGPNGAGKTTLIKAILNLVKFDEGKITFPALKPGKKCEQIAYVPQIESVDWDFPTTVLDVVMMGRYGHLGLFKRVGKHEKEMALEILNKVGMEEYANRQIKKLSGGQQQRVFLARAVIQDAQLYFMDEPFKGVDIKSQQVIIGILKELKQLGKTIIVVHHDLNTIKQYFDLVVIVNKSIIASGSIDQTCTQENINQAYGEILLL